MNKSVAKVINVVAVVALLLFSLLVPAFAYDYTETVDFSTQSFNCLAQPKKDDPDGSVNITGDITRTRITYDGVQYTQFTVPVKYTRYYKLFQLGMNGLSLKTDCDYKFSFKFYQNFNTPQTVIAQLRYVDGEGNTSFSELGTLNAPNPATPVEFSGTVHTPTLGGVYQINLILLIGSNGGITTTTHRFCFSDFKFELDSPLYGEHYENDTDEIDDLNDRIIAVEGMLPSMDDVNFDDLLKDVDVARYNNGFIAVNSIFSRVIGSLEIAPVIIFCLAIGLCTYLLGRRLSA